jgi:hypothetical protein
MMPEEPGAGVAGTREQDAGVASTEIAGMRDEVAGSVNLMEQGAGVASAEIAEMRDEGAGSASLTEEGAGVASTELAERMDARGAPHSQPQSQPSTLTPHPQSQPSTLIPHPSPSTPTSTSTLNPQPSTPTLNPQPQPQPQPSTLNPQPQPLHQLRAAASYWFAQLGERAVERTGGRFGWKRAEEAEDIMVVYLGGLEVLAMTDFERTKTEEP